MLLTSIFIVLFIYISTIIYEQWNKYSKLSQFKGPPVSSSILGNWDILQQPIDELCGSLRHLAKEYYPHYKLRILHEVAVTVLSPDDCEKVMGTKKHSSKSILYLILSNWLKSGLLLSSGQKWLQRRKILTPAFHFNILKNFLLVFNEETTKLVKVISNKGSQPIDVVPLISDYTLRSINETAMGHQLDTNPTDLTKYIDAIHEMGKIFAFKVMRPWLYYPWMFKFSPLYKKEKSLLNIVHNFTRNIIQSRMQTFRVFKENSAVNEVNSADDGLYLNQKKKRRLAMLDILMEAHYDDSQIDYDGICEEVDTFMFEGHDTTSCSLAFTLMLIANHPKIQEEIHSEIKSILGENPVNPSYEDLQKMDILERTIKESLRLYPSVHFVSRLSDEEILLSSGLVIPRNSTVHIQIFDIHRNPEIYPDPEKFDPDRFLPDSCQGRHPFAYIPFSAGPRNCIGQKFAMLEMKSLLVGIIQKFRIIPIDTPETIVLWVDLVLRAKNGVKMKFVPRY